MAKMLELKLKLYHLGEAKTISCKKTDTLDQLIEWPYRRMGSRVRL